MKIATMREFMQIGKGIEHKMDIIQKFLTYNGKISIICATTTSTVETARRTHDLSPIATAALGRTLTMASILGANLKSEEDSLTIQIKGNGPIGSIVATSNSKAEVRGYVTNPIVELPLRDDGKLNVGEAVGKDGFLYIIKDIGLKEPYTGMAKLVTGEIAEDFANYFYQSEQNGVAVALGVLVDKDGVKSSGGYMITAMPDATEDELFILENRLKESKPISQMLEENMSLYEIAQDITGDSNLQILDDKKQPMFKCNCSKEKMETALSTIGKQELQKIIEEDKKAELVCRFCNSAYEFSEEELKRLIGEIE